MIYDILETQISGLISTQYEDLSGHVLTEYEVPDDEDTFFCRLSWTFGRLEDMSNICDQELPTLNIEVYEKKSIGKIKKFVEELRYFLKKEIKPYIFTDSIYSKLNEIYISKNVNDPDWTAYTLSLSFIVINTR